VKTLVVAGLALLCATAAARATNLRGVIKYPPPIYGTGPAGVAVTLAGNGFTRQTITSGNGFYFFFGVPAGSYVLTVGRGRYGVTVLSQSSQDIAPILLSR
jgi:hypothetical protein